MANVSDLLNLPAEVLAVAGAGYIGYRIAFTGKDAQHKSVDVLFLSAAFGLVAQLAMLVASAMLTSQATATTPDVVALIQVITIGIGLACAALVAIAWRKTMEKRIRDYLFKNEIVRLDRTKSIWERIATDETGRVLQLVVKKVDGTTLLSSDLRRFSDLHLGPCLHGPDGSVSMYVTESKLAGQSEWEEHDPIDAEWGALMTHIPASKIEIVEIRYEV